MLVPEVALGTRLRTFNITYNGFHGRPPLPNSAGLKKNAGLRERLLLPGLITLLGISVIGATADKDPVADCEALVKSRLPANTSYFRLGYRMVRDSSTGYTLHITFFSSGRWLATCRLSVKNGDFQIHDAEVSRVAWLASD